MNSSSSGDEVLTIAYTESVVDDVSDGEDGTTDSAFSFSPLSSSSLETPTSQESYTSQIAELDWMRETELYFGYKPVWRTMSTTPGTKMQTLDYFWTNSVYQLFTFLMSHLLAHTPDDPLPFLVSLVDRCIRYCDLDGEPPLLFEDSHVGSVYTALDPAGDGSITFSQYLAGMNTLGVTDFNLMPNENESNNRNVSKNVFLKEAKLALLKQLDQILGKEVEVSTVKMDDEELRSKPSSEHKPSEGDVSPEDFFTEDIDNGTKTSTKDLTI